MTEEWRDSTRRAYDALARYKFWMFGYHAGRAVYVATLIERMGGPKLANPFRSVVMEARRLYCRSCGEMREPIHLCSAKSTEWQERWDALLEPKHLSEPVQ